MSTQYPETTNSHGTFCLTRGDDPSEFVCDRCLLPKTARATIEWANPRLERTKTLCVACYGTMRAT